MKDQAQVIREIFVLRSIACLGIVLFNTLGSAIDQFSLSESTDHTGMLEVIHSVQMLLMFSTPMFVFISEIIMSRSYGKQIPSGFLVKRAKYILIPYLAMAILYSIVDVYMEFSEPTIKNYLIELAKNVIMADFFGYFLLVIFQFYLLHIYFVKYVLQKFPMRSVIAWAVAINIIYLAAFNLFDLTSLPFANYYLVSFLNKVPIFAWIAYFTIAFYCGQHYESIIAYLNRKLKWVLGFVVLSGAIVMGIYLSAIIGHIYSKRFDVLIYTICVIFALLGLSSRMRQVPAVLVSISRYSFGIFLLTRFILFGVSKFGWVNYSPSRFLLFSVLSFFAAIIGSVGITYVLNKIRFGPYIVGRIGVDLTKPK